MAFRNPWSRADWASLYAAYQKARYDRSLVASPLTDLEPLMLKQHQLTPTERMIAATVHHRGPLFGENILQCLFPALFWPPPQCSQWFYETHVAPLLAGKQMEEAK